jgi:hypothetical protein
VLVTAPINVHVVSNGDSMRGEMGEIAAVARVLDLMGGSEKMA